jgi:hypothetical protein
MSMLIHFYIIVFKFNRNRNHLSIFSEAENVQSGSTSLLRVAMNEFMRIKHGESEGIRYIERGTNMK